MEKNNMLRPTQALLQRTTNPLSHILLNQAKTPSVIRVAPFSQSSSPELNKDALATKDQLHRVELGLTKEISGVREGLTKEISGVESRLTEKFTRELSGVREGLTKEISGVREQIEKNQSILLVAIQGQNTKFEAFKLHIYKLIGGVAAAVIGYANRDRLLQGIASVIK
jgi:hypothetical protein